MNNVLAVATRELREGVRNRWVFSATLLLAVLALTLTFLGSAPTGAVSVHALDVVIVSLSSLSIFLVPLIALLIAHDAIVGEVERGTMLLVLSYPIGRSQVLLGKFLGHLSIVALATATGFGAAAVAVFFTNETIATTSWTPFVAMLGSSILLGAVFLATGYLVSALAKTRGGAAGAAIAIWLLFVLVYDMALLSALALDQGRTISAGAVRLLLLLNPTDAYRLFNLAGFANVGAFSGMAGLSGAISIGLGEILAALALWCLVPLAVAAAVFSRRPI